VHPERIFYFQLAEMMGCTVGELLDKISTLELTEWRAFLKIRADEIPVQQEKAKQRAQLRKTAGRG